jgi:EmrB/QacA subfamily drug resistance transporter
VNTSPTNRRDQYADRDASPYGHRWAALGVLCVSLLVIVIDNTIVNVTLPTLVGELKADMSELQWVVDAYTLVFAGLLLLAGTLGDRFGRRRTLLAGLGVFAIASAAAAFASGVGQLVSARAVMGAGAAFIMPATLSLLTNIFTDARERAMAIGLWAATAGVGVALGPVAGGFLLDHFWWGSVFIVNVPIVVAALVTGRILVPESRNPVAQRIDWIGALLSGVGLIAFVWAIIEAPGKGWTSAPVAGAAALAVITLLGFVAWERRVDEPLLDVRLFRNARFTAASLTVMVLFFALFGFLFASTQYLQFVLGYAPSAAGLRMLPYALAMIVAAPLSSKLVGVFGTKRVVTAGMLTFASGLAIAATVTTATGYPRLAIAMLFMGAGMGLAAAPATESIMGSLPRDRAGIGSAVNDTTREIGGALGVAVVGSIMSSLYGTQLTRNLPENVPAPAAAAARGSVGTAVNLGGNLGAQVAEAGRDAFVHAMSRGSIVVAVIAAAGALIAWRYLPARGEESAGDGTEGIGSGTIGEIDMAITSSSRS